MLIGVVIAVPALWISGAGIWAGMLTGGVAAFVAGPPLTALLRVRLVPVGIEETPMR